MSFPSKKTDQNEVNETQDLFQCSKSSAYCQQKRSSTKRGHLISQVKNTAVKWYIKPCIVKTKNVSKALIQEVVEEVINNEALCH